jgi:drug/metabolite transporter (DMT)-like permease
LSAIFIIAGRVIASPLVNVFQKKLTNKDVSPELIVSVSYLFFVLLSIPVFIYLKPFDLPGEFWLYISLLGVFDIFGNMFLVKSLRTIDLSVFGPLNSYKPIFAIVFSVLLLGEIPTFWGSLGVLIIVAGSYFLNYKESANSFSIKNFFKNRGLVFRFLAIALTAIAAVFSKKAILLSSPLIVLMYWSVIGWPISVLMVMKLKVKWRNELDQIKKHKMHFGLLVVSFLALQFFTLLAFEKIFVGYSLALFQLSALISVLFGALFFKEKNIKYRLIGAFVMVIGAIFIALLG